MISITPSTGWRDALGRFASLDAGNVLGTQLLSDAPVMVAKLRAATPVKTGAAQASWSSTYYPSARQLRITNKMNYTTFLITGTRHMAANPALKAAVESLPVDAQVSLHSAGVTIMKQMKGSA